MLFRPSVLVAFIIAVVVALVDVPVLSGQFEGLAAGITGREKLEDFFLQADEGSQSYAVVFRNREFLVDELKDVTKTMWTTGLTVRSSKQKLRFSCFEYEGVGDPPLAWRSESLVVSGLEKRRSYSTQLPKGETLKAVTVENDPATGMLAEITKKDPYWALAKEIDPYGLILGGRHCSKGRNSDLNQCVKEWLTRWELEAETEEKGLLRTTWKLEGSKGRRREIVFDSQAEYLPTLCRVILSDEKGKKFDSEVRTKWERNKNGQWRHTQCVVTTHSGAMMVEETFDFVWTEIEDLDLFLSERDFGSIVKDDYSNWYKLFSDFVGNQQLSALKNDK